MTTLFISDLHLDEKRPDITRAFFRFLEDKAIHAHQLYILGDFFEVWIGDDALSDFHKEILSALRKLSDQCNVFFMHGNRDFLIGERFADFTGCILISDPTILTLYGTKTLLLHGDSLCTEDKEYMAFRHMVRNPDWQAAFSAKPLEERVAIARQLREKSQEQTASKDEYITDVTPSEVEKILADTGCPLMIHGHTHRPARHDLSIQGLPAERIVLGDWGSSGWYIEANENSISLEEYQP